MPVVIQIRKRSDDYHAMIANNPGLWECGRSYAEAIGKLILTHPERFEDAVQLVDMPKTS